MGHSLSFQKTENKTYPFMIQFKGEKLFESEGSAREFMRALDGVLD